MQIEDLQRISEDCDARRRAGIHLAVVLACGASPGGAASGVVPRFEPGACPSRVASSPAFAHAQCGQLIVPENRQKQNGKTISISVAIIPSVAQPPKHEPLFYITGGPGGDAMGDIEFLVPALNQDQNLIVLAQRGTLDATPALLCPEIDAFDTKAVSLVYDAPSTGALHVAATKACHDRFVAEGVDLSAYNTLENIEDFVDLRKVLGAEVEHLRNVLRHLRRAPPDASASGEPGERDDRLHLAPQRGGPRMALEQCRRRGSRICSMPVPPSLPAPRNTAMSGASSPARCKSSRRHPLTVTSHYADGGPPVQVVLDGGALVNWLVAGGRATFAAAPSAIQELADGNPAQIVAARAALANPPKKAFRVMA